MPKRSLNLLLRDLGIASVLSFGLDIVVCLGSTSVVLLGPSLDPKAVIDPALGRNSLIYHRTDFYE